MDRTLSLLPPVGLTAVMGQAGSGKTTLMVEIANYCATLGHPVSIFMLDGIPDFRRDQFPSTPVDGFTEEAFDAIPEGSVVLVDGADFLDTAGMTLASFLGGLAERAEERTIRLIVSLQTKRGPAPANVLPQDKQGPFRLTIHLGPAR